VIVGKSSIDFKPVQQKMEDGTYEPMVEIDQNGMKSLAELAQIKVLVHEALEAMRIASMGQGELRD
jgi:hypothetical protein